MATDTAAGRPRDTRIDAAVLDAARAVIAEVGYAGLTFTEVAARAGTSVPAIRRRWPSKSHLVHRVVFPVEVAIPPRNPHATLDDELDSVIDGCASLFSDAAMRRALMGVFSELADDDDLQREVTDRLRFAVWEDLTERLTLAAARDEVTIEPDPSLLIEAAFGATLMAVMLRGVKALDDQWRSDLHRALWSILVPC
ncbi:helix-turn-helix domain-containing protein [Gordonia malaquae]|uniref:TetR/AcrR family transcriptional regulator n=1 Tax=Gordonia malaquae TaxID=410332 RepID=UPI0030FF3ECD